MSASGSRQSSVWPLRVAAWSMYPIIFGGGVAALATVVGSGVAYWKVGPPILVATAVAVVLLERWLPHAREWRLDHGDTRTDFAHYVSNVSVNQAAAAGYALVYVVAGGGMRLWPTEAPFWLQFLFATAVIDLGLYGVHRSSHLVGWLWKLHAIHHSATRIYWVNGQRRHLVHELLEGAPGLLVLGVLGAPPTAVACGFAALTMHLMFQHANIAYRAGPLRYIFAVAALHRWHHQRRYEDVQGNYGAIFSVWDRTSQPFRRTGSVRRAGRSFGAGARPCCSTSLTRRALAPEVVVRGKMHARVQVEALVHHGIPHARRRTRKLGLRGLVALLGRLERASLHPDSVPLRLAPAP